MPLGAFKAALMGTAGVSTADVVLLSTQTASSSATISFTSDITSTYREYIFRFYNIHPASHANFTFNGSTDSGSNYDVTKTTTATSAYHAEDGSAAAVYYVTANDLAQSTAFQPISGAVYTDNDSSVSGELHLFNPSSTTYVKHFYATTQRMDYSDPLNYTNQYLVGGYFNTTSAIDAVQFKMASGNMDAGKIKMWGVK